MIKNALKVILGFNLISLQKLFLSGGSSFVGACMHAFTASHVADSKELLSIPKVTLENILKGNQTITLSVGDQENGSLPYNQAVALISILAKEQPSVAVEIGTFLGHTTKLMAQNLPNGKIHTIDLPPNFDKKDDHTILKKDDFHLIESRKVGREFLGTPFAERIMQHFGDTISFDFKKIERATFFFIDGSHTYDYCKNDSDKCFELCNGKGVFVWHDCDHGHMGVVQLVNEWRKLGRNVVRIEGTPLAYLKTI